MRKIAIFGAGGFGREVACLIKEINLTLKKDDKWNLIGFIDDGKEIDYKTEYGSVLGNLSFLNSYNKKLAVVFAIGNPSIIKLVHSKINNNNIYYPNIIASDFRCLDKNNMTMGEGNIILSKCSISCNVKIGCFNVLNSSIAIGHDANIGDYNVFMPGTRISGEVKIGHQNSFGIYSVVLQQLIIGNNTIIAPSSVVMRRTKNNTTYIGNPAKKLNY